MVTAATGQGATQAPQPVHASAATSGTAAPPTRGGKRIARGVQKSPQMRHSIPWRGRQAGPMAAPPVFLCGNCRVSGSARLVRKRQHAGQRLERRLYFPTNALMLL